MRLASLVLNRQYIVVFALTFLFCKKISAQCSAPTNVQNNNYYFSPTYMQFTWDAVPTATSYQYAVTNSSTPPASGTSSIYPDGFKNFTLADNYTRYLHLRAICPSGTSSWTTICVATPNTLGGTGEYCVGESVNIGIPITVPGQQYTWYKIDGFSSTPVHGPVNGDGGSQSYLFSISAASQSGEFEVRTSRSGCQQTYFGDVAIKFNYPKDLVTSSITTNSVNFNWAYQGAGVDYEYAVTNISTPPANGTFTNSNSAVVNGLTPYTNYYIHVRASCSGSYNPWNSVAFTTQGVLPVKMEFFKAKNIANANVLNWKSLCAGSPSSKFNFSIERSEDGSKFNSVHSFNATHERCLQPFEFSDGNTTSQINFYRIKVTDDAGKITYSSTLKLDNKIDKPAYSIFPNPIKDASVLQLQLNRDAKIDVTIHDVAGKLLYKIIDGVKYTNGTHQLSLNTATLSSGIYLCKVLVDGTEQQVLKLVKQ